MKGTPPTVLRQNEPVGGCMGAFSRKHGRPKADSKAMGFYLYMTLHQDHLKGPAL